MDSIKVELTNDGNFIGIRTYDRNHGSRGRFLVARATIIIAASSDNRQTVYDSDCGSFIAIWRDREDLWVRLTWLNEDSIGNVWGYKQLIMIPGRLIYPILTKIGRTKYLYRPERMKATIITTRASAAIRLILEDKLKRRAFSKAMRDCFRWPGETVTLYNDLYDSFYFTTESGFPKNGGLVLHEGKNCTYPCYYYSVHT